MRINILSAKIIHLRVTNANTYTNVTRFIAKYITKVTD